MLELIYNSHGAMAAGEAGVYLVMSEMLAVLWDFNCLLRIKWNIFVDVARRRGLHECKGCAIEALHAVQDLHVYTSFFCRSGRHLERDIWYL